MLSPKNRALLKSLANRLEPSLTVGKGEIDKNILETVKKALLAHELIKVRVLTSHSEETAKAGEALAQGAEAELVSTIGHVVTLYKKREANPAIVLADDAK
jgi:RNA-binding protein